jgi:hypothetical protein
VTVGLRIAAATATAMVLTLALAWAEGRARTDPCSALSRDECRRLDALIHRLTREVAEADRWRPVDTGAPISSFADAIDTAELVDAADWPEAAGVDETVLRRLREELEEDIESGNRAWDSVRRRLFEEYTSMLDRIHTIEEVHIERTSISSSLAGARAAQSALEELYLQNLSGYPIAMLVVGSATWDGSTSIASFRRHMLRRMGEAAVEAGSATIVSAATEVVSGRLTQESLVAQSDGRVQAFEGDPLCVARRRDQVCVQIFRCTQDFDPDGDGGGAIGDSGAEDPLAAEVDVKVLEVPLENQLASTRLVRDEAARATVEQMADRVEVFNGKRAEGVARLYSEYSTQIVAARERVRDLERRYLEIDNRLSYLVETSANGSATTAADPDRVLDHLRQRLQDKEQAIDRLLANRDYVVFTVCREHLQDNQTTAELRRTLAAEALRNLDQRGRQLQSRKIIRVANGVLESVEAREVYDRARIVSLIVPAFVLSYPETAPLPEAGTSVRGSIVVGARIRLDRGGEPRNETAPPVVAGLPNTGVSPNAGAAPNTGAAPNSGATANEPSPPSLIEICGARPARTGVLVPCLAEGIAYDTDTGLLWSLVWTRTATNRWDAQQRAAGYDGLGSQGWRLPAVREILSLSPESRAALELPRWGRFWTSDHIGRGHHREELVVVAEQRSVLRITPTASAAILMVRDTGGAERYH